MIRSKVSLVVPFYNEGAGVQFFYERITAVLQRCDHVDFEIVCVDDGSNDDTLSRLTELADNDIRVLVVELSRNFGKEAALTAGIDVATGDAVIPMDADLQDPPELIPDMLVEWSRGAEVVLARRVDRNSDTRLKIATAKLFYRIHNMLSPVRIPENVGDFRLMDRLVVDALKQLPEQQRFMKGLFAWVGFRTVTLDYRRCPRQEGKTKFSGSRLWGLAIDGMTSFSTIPMKIWSYIGLFGAIGTLIYAMFTIIKTLVYGVDVPGYASLLVAVLFLGSMQLISIGILGEYVGRIHLESKQRPIYLIRKKYARPQCAKPASITSLHSGNGTN